MATERGRAADVGAVARFAFDRHAAVAILAALLGLLVPVLASSGPVSGSATSVEARAASTGDDGDGRAAAERFPVGGPSLETAMRVSAEHWGGPACGGNVALSWVPMDEGTNATASWKNPTDAWNNASANFDCKVELNSALDFDWEKLCSVVAHEVGHLMGQQHASVGGELMSPIYSGPLGACTRTPDPAAPAAPAPQSAPAAPRVAPPAPEQRRSTAAPRLRLCARSARAKRSSRARRCGTRGNVRRWSTGNGRRYRAGGIEKLSRH